MIGSEFVLNERVNESVSTLGKAEDVFWDVYHLKWICTEQELIKCAGVLVCLNPEESSHSLDSCAGGLRPETARMGGGGQLTEPGEPGSGRGGSVYTWEEVQSHCSRNDQWLVINRKVYNITHWAKRHPGGVRVISHYAGEDATDAFAAFHPDPKFVQKFLKPLLIGELAATEPSQDRNKNAAIIKDFQTLRGNAEREGLFQARPLFFCLHLGHILLLEALAWLIVWLWGTSWTLTLLCSVILATAQAQAGWLQHDFGHLSVFKKSSWNHFLHKFIIGHLKGASANWWNHRHFQHHAKPNIFSKDPDVNMVHVFVVGATQPVEAIRCKKDKAHALSSPAPVLLSHRTSAAHSSLFPHSDNALHDLPPRLGGSGLVHVLLSSLHLLLFTAIWPVWINGAHQLRQVSGESLVRVGDSNESSADGYRPREAQGLAEHAVTCHLQY
ncbi:acyl-CoA 6-desaturase [Scomber scombrus]|uniref:acyl-CoA (8-3)-desaturase n=1 Tax=Scomber scombrus TaxID=13677 RepID=A0AAV1NPE7_SCOSC